MKSKLNGKLFIIILLLSGILFSIALRWIFIATETNQITPMTFPTNIHLPATSEQLYYGNIHYKIRCSKCHGIKNINNKEMQPIQTHKTKKELYSIIYYGIPNTNMKGWGKKLQPQDILSIVHYLKSLNKEKPH